MNANDPAFPLPQEWIDRRITGLTKREHFASLVFQAWISNSLSVKVAHDAAKEAGITASAFIAAASVEMADALIAELNK